MPEENLLINRVAQSGLITIDLEHFLPKAGQIQEFDLKPYLVQETVLMEKPFRQALKEIDWQQYTGQLVTVTCSVDTIIPKWAYMLVATYLQPVAANIYFGTLIEVENRILFQHIEQMNTADYQDARVIVKGCGKRDIPAEAYMNITEKLLPVVKSLMYGEPCSTVPVYKSKS